MKVAKACTVLVLAISIGILAIPSLLGYNPEHHFSDLRLTDQSWLPAASLVNDWITRNNLSGMVLLASRGEVRMLRSYGWSDTSLRMPNSESTRFNIGSLAKQFTGFILLQLEREKKIDLGNSVDTYLSELKGTAVGSIPLIHLTQHSSGLPVLPHLAKYLRVQMGSKAWTTDEFIAEIRDYQPDFKPGTGFQYSNVGYRLLGAVIERVERQTFRDVLQKRILSSVGMTGTYLQSSDENPDGLAKSYGPVRRFWLFGDVLYLPIPNWNYSMLIGAGGLVTTIQDLYRWDRSLAKLSQDDPEFTSRYFMGGGPTDYSYGWGIVRENHETGLPSYQIHTGGTPGFGSVIFRVPDKDAVVVVLFNSFWNGIEGETDFYRDLVRAVGRVE